MTDQQISDAVPSGGYPVSEAAYDQPVVNIGSNPGNDLVLAGSSIADFHCMLVFQENEWLVMPLDPSTQVLLNQRPLSVNGSSFRAGDSIDIGDYQLRPSINGTALDILVYQMRNTAGAAIKTIETNDGSKMILLNMLNTPNEVAAGDEVEYEVEIINGGPLVANMRIQLQGIPDEWVKITPPLLNLNEAQHGNFSVRISPPRKASSLAGMYHVHFLVTSPNYPRQTGVADADLNVLPFYEFLIGGLNPRQQSASRMHPTAQTELPIINLSNTDVVFSVSTAEGENKVDFSYIVDGNELTGVAPIPVKAGETRNLPIRVSPHSLPIFSFYPRLHNYTTSVSIPAQPTAAQATPGDVRVKPAFNWLLLLLLLLILLGLLMMLFQPRILDFRTDAEQNIITSGSMTELSWKVSRFARTLTLSSGEEKVDVNRQGSYQIAPKVSTSYKLTAENWFSRLLNLTHQRELNVLVVPDVPKIDVFEADKSSVMAGTTVNTRWSVSGNTDKATLDINKQLTTLTTEQYSGQRSDAVTTDVLTALSAQNASGSVVRSFFINVIPAKVKLKTYAIWVKPFEGSVDSGDGAAASNVTWTDSTHGSTSTSTTGTEDGSTKTNTTTVTTDPSPTSFTTDRTHVRAMLADQMNVLIVPDNLNGSGSVGDQSGTGTPPAADNTAITTEMIQGAKQQNPFTPPQNSAPKDSPEVRGISSAFSVKLCEIVPDRSSPTGYRVVNYYPGYELPEQTQIMLEWAVEGVTSVKIDPLSADPLSASGVNFYFPKESMNFTLNAESGDDKETFLLPVNVIGPNDPSKKTTTCKLTAVPNALTASGNVVLSWSVIGPSSRITLASSSQAEKEVQAVKDQLKKDAEAKGETYVEPANVASGGGLIADYIQTSGFMSVNVSKKTSFTLEAFNGSAAAACSAQADVAVATDAEADKLKINLRITNIADENNVSHQLYLVGKKILVTAQLFDWDKEKKPSGTIAITDGLTSCSITYPATTCALTPASPGKKTLTATYSGDTNYRKATATAEITVVGKIPTTITIDPLTPSRTKYYAEQTPVVNATLEWVDLISEDPTGDVTIQGYDKNWNKVDSSKCSYKLPENHCTLPLTKDVTKLYASYEGDDYYEASESDEYPISVNEKIPTFIEIDDVVQDKGTYYADEKPIVYTWLDWDDSILPKTDPTGNVTIQGYDGSGWPVSGITCSFTLPADNCDLPLSVDVAFLAASYAGDTHYEASESEYEWDVKVIRRDLTLELTQPDAGQYFETTTGKHLYPWNPDEMGDQKPADYCAAYPAKCHELSNKTTASVKITYPSKEASRLPDGTVIQVNDGSDGTCTITLPNLSCDLTFISPGIKTMHAILDETPVYHAASDAVSYEHVVDLSGSTKTVTVIENPHGGNYVLGQEIDVSVKVTEDTTAGSTTPTGKVTVYDEKHRSFCEMNYSYSGTTSCKLRLMTTGLGLKLYAAYAGSASWLPSVTDINSGVKSINVGAYGKTPVTLTIKNPVAGSSFEQFAQTEVSIGMVESAGGTDILTSASGLVQISDGTGNYCEISLPVSGSEKASCSLALKTSGTLNLTAAYAGDATYKSATSDSVRITVNTNSSNKCKSSITIDKFTDNEGKELAPSPYVAFGSWLRVYYTVSTPDGVCSTCTTGNCALDGNVKITLRATENTSYTLQCGNAYHAAAPEENYCRMMTSLPANSTNAFFSVHGDYFGDTHYSNSSVDDAKKAVNVSSDKSIGKYDNEVSITGVRYNQDPAVGENLKGGTVLAGKDVWIDFTVHKVDFSSPVSLIEAFGDVSGYDNCKQSISGPVIGKVYTCGPIRYQDPGWRRVLGRVTFTNVYNTQSDFKIQVVAAKSLSITPSWYELGYSGSGGSCLTTKGTRITDDVIQTSSNGLVAGDGLRAELDLKPISGSGLTGDYAVGQTMGSIYAEECFFNGYCVKSASASVVVKSDLKAEATVDLDILPQRGTVRVTFYFASGDGKYTNAEAGYAIPVAEGVLYLYPNGAASSDVQSSATQYEWQLPADAVEATHAFDAYLLQRGNPGCKARLSHSLNSSNLAFYLQPDGDYTEMLKDGVNLSGCSWGVGYGGYQYTCKTAMIADAFFAYHLLGGSNYATPDHTIRAVITHPAETGFYITEITPTDLDISNPPSGGLASKVTVQLLTDGTVPTGKVKLFSARNGATPVSDGIEGTFVSSQTNPKLFIYTGTVSFTKTGTYQISAQFSGDSTLPDMSAESSQSVTVTGYPLELTGYLEFHVTSWSYNSTTAACRNSGSSAIGLEVKDITDWDFKMNDKKFSGRIYAGNQMGLQFTFKTTSPGDISQMDVSDQVSLTVSFCSLQYPDICVYTRGTPVAPTSSSRTFSFDVEMLPVGGSYTVDLEVVDSSGYFKNFSKELTMTNIYEPVIVLSGPRGSRYYSGDPKVFEWQDFFGTDGLTKSIDFTAYALKDAIPGCLVPFNSANFPKNPIYADGQMFLNGSNSSCTWVNLDDGSRVFRCNQPTKSGTNTAWVKDKDIYYKWNTGDYIKILDPSPTTTECTDCAATTIHTTDIPVIGTKSVSISVSIAP